MAFCKYYISQFIHWNGTGSTSTLMFYSADSKGHSKSISSFSSPLISTLMHFVIRRTIQKFYTASFFFCYFYNLFHQELHILTTITTAHPHQFELRWDEKLLIDFEGHNVSGYKIWANLQKYHYVRPAHQATESQCLLATYLQRLTLSPSLQLLNNHTAGCSLIPPHFQCCRCPCSC